MLNTKVYRISTTGGPFSDDERRALTECAAIIKAGGLVAFPTETVYGLGALATDSSAVRSIFAAKGRPQDNPLITHVASFGEARSLARDIPAEAELLADAFWPGPLTLVLKSRGIVAPEVTAGLDTLGVRVPAHRVALELIRLAGPIAAPSANRSGLPSTTTAEHVLTDLNGRIDAVLDAGPTGVGVESTVLDMTRKPPEILRHGGVTIEMLRKVIPDTQVAETHGATKPRSPGQKYTHYSPKARLVLVKGRDAASVLSRVLSVVDELLAGGHRTGILATSENAGAYRRYFASAVADKRVIVTDVGSRQHTEDIANRLFAALRDMDSAAAETVVAEGVQEKEIGAAIMDRLGRAASRVIDAASGERAALRVLLVCTGNTCRSPLAEVLFRREAERVATAAQSFEFSSRGTSAGDGEPATQDAIRAAKEVGLDLGSHRAKRLSVKDCLDADLILTMTDAHKAEVLRRCPDASGKTFAVGDVPDPIGKGLSAYRETVALLAKYAQEFFGEVLS